MQDFNDGSPIDRAILLLLILAALGILTRRSFQWTQWLSANRMFCAFILFGCLSVLWSDYPLVALKRWLRDAGGYAMICVVLSDPRPYEALQVVFRRVSYIFVSLSIVLIKYFPNIGIQYDEWNGARMACGVTTGKNNLGAIALLAGLLFFWDILTRWPQRKQPKTKRIIMLSVTFLLLSLWLLRAAHSTTCIICFVLGSAVIALARLSLVRRNRIVLKALIPAVFCLYLLLSFGLGLSASMAKAVGKDPTLTDRTEIWGFVIDMHTNPLVGVGYESFWMGSHLARFWEESGQGRITEAHNGYLQVYLEMGLIGDALVTGLLVSSYRSIWAKWTDSDHTVTFGLAIWIAFVFFNMTEAAFEGTFMFTMFLMATMRAPIRASRQKRNVGTSKFADRTLLPIAAELQKSSQ